MAQDEAAAVAVRYARRQSGDLYSPLRAEVLRSRQERERAVVALFTRRLRKPLAELDILELGCGNGDNLLDLLRLGCDPARLTGNELLPDRAATARRRLPAATAVLAGDALALNVPPASQDLVLQYTVFSSILDDDFQQRLADRLWSWLRPGGAVLWYDFTVDNPRNPDVRGVTSARMRELFPHASVQEQRLTLAPPIARRVVRLHPAAWTLFNSLPLLRTHSLAWIEKA